MKIRLLRLTVVSALLVFFVPVRASSQADMFLTRLLGNWQGEGTVLGKAATVQINWEWILNDKFLRLSVRHETNAPNNTKQIFEGQAYYYAQGTDKYAAHWFDSRGVTFTIKSHVEGNTLTSFWGSPDTEEGKSTYQLIDGTTLRVVDAVKQKDGTFREFSSATLKRK